MKQMDIVECQLFRPVVCMDHYIHLGFPKNIFTAAINVCILPLQGMQGKHTFENHGTAPWFIQYRNMKGMDQMLNIFPRRMHTLEFVGTAWHYMG
jgi:hypothetical protein